jgi:hypothetical protein
MPYTPPAGDSVNFGASGDYTPPAGNDVNFLFGTSAYITIESISRNTIYDDQAIPGLNRSVVRWKSSVGGPFKKELGGSGAETGDLLKSGNTFANFSVRTELTDADLEGATSFSGAGSYRINVYVKSDDDVWTPYGQE